MKNIYTLQRWAFVFCFLFSFFSLNVFAQVGIGTSNPNPNALLDLDASTTPGGLLLPRMDLSGTNSFAPMTANVAGMVVYNTATSSAGPDQVTPGYYYNDGTQWVRVATGSSSDWTISGNASTTPGTTSGQNYFGTSDAKALIIATQALERMRILDNGQVIINNTAAPVTGDRFTVQGSSDEFTINGYGTGALGVGIYGENGTTNGTAIFGNAAVGYGVYGQSTAGGIGVDGYNPTTGLGVRGYNGGSGIGVAGYNTSTGIATYGWNQGTGDGVRGDAANAQNGVYGQNTGANGSGVYGITNRSNGYGVRAANLATGGTGLFTISGGSGGNILANSGLSANGPTAGSFSLGNTNTGTGVVGAGNNTGNYVTYANGGGVAGSGTRNGLFGYAGNGSVVAANRGNAGGVFLLDTDNNTNNNGGANDNGIRATAVLAGFDNLSFNNNVGTGFPAKDSYFGGYFSGGTERTGAPATTPSYAYVGLRYDTSVNGRTGSTDFKIVGPGNVSTLINDEKNIPRIMFAPESPEIVFQDYGVGQLINGKAYISLDPVLKQSLFIDSEHPLKVFVTLEGDCKGIYVTNKSADGFMVKELQNGTSNVPFSWQIVANRADTKDASGNVVSKHVGLRLPIGPGPLEVKAKNIEGVNDTKTDGIKTSVSSPLNNVVERPVKISGTSAAEINNDSQPQDGGNTSEVERIK